MSVCPNKFTEYDTKKNDQVCVKTNSTTFCCAPKEEVNDDSCFSLPIMKTILLQFWDISSISVELKVQDTKGFVRPNKPGMPGFKTDGESYDRQLANFGQFEKMCVYSDLRIKFKNGTEQNVFSSDDLAKQTKRKMVFRLGCICNFLLLAIEIDSTNSIPKKISMIYQDHEFYTHGNAIVGQDFYLIFMINKFLGYYQFLSPDPKIESQKFDRKVLKYWIDVTNKRNSKIKMEAIQAS